MLGTSLKLSPFFFPGKRVRHFVEDKSFFSLRTMSLAACCTSWLPLLDAQTTTFKLTDSIFTDTLYCVPCRCGLMMLQRLPPAIPFCVSPVAVAWPVRM